MTGSLMRGTNPAGVYDQGVGEVRVLLERNTEP